MNQIILDNKKITPSKIVCIGRNYVDHIHELGNEMPDNMVVFNKPNSAISDDLLSFHEEQLHYESELCFVYLQGRFAAVGFGLDLTKRQLQSKLKAKSLPWERAKAFDNSAVFSPFVSIDSIDNNLALELVANGEIRQAGNVELMIYKPDFILSELSQFMTLNDGDIVMTGTPQGVGFINRGDVFTGKVKHQEQLLVQAQWQAI